MSEANRLASLRLWADGGYRERQIAAALRRWQDPDYRAAQRRAQERIQPELRIGRKRDAASKAEAD